MCVSLPQSEELSLPSAKRLRLEEEGGGGEEGEEGQVEGEGEEEEGEEEDEGMEEQMKEFFSELDMDFLRQKRKFLADGLRV